MKAAIPTGSRASIVLLILLCLLPSRGLASSPVAMAALPSLVLGNPPLPSTRGYHVAIWLEGQVIDAYTGPAGLPFREYMARLNTSPGSKIVEEVVQTL